jgi:hypothetical protein
MIRAEQIRGALSPTAVLDHFGIKYQRGAELRTQICPACGPRSRDSVAVNASTGMWSDHAHGCAGDILALVAGLAGLDVRAEFPRVVALAAEIAGISPDGLPPELERKIGERRRADAERAATDEAERKRVLAAMPGRWNSLAHRSTVGERYLAGRGLDPAALREVGDVVRYTASGDPAVALRDLVSGAIVGYQHRQVIGDLKLSAPGSQVAGSVLYGRIADLDPDGADVAALVEGLADTLAAHLAFPTCAVFGAAGWRQLGRIAAAIAPRLVEARGWLLIVPHVDGGPGEQGAADAVIAAEDAGLVLHKSIRLVDVRPDNDLADAHARGWRWAWPT